MFSKGKNNKDDKSNYMRIESMLGRRDRMVWNAYPDTIVGKLELFQFSTVQE